MFAETELNLRDAFSHVITGESYHLSRFHVPEMERAIEDNLRDRVFDVIILESLFTTSYIPAIRRLSDAELVLRAHNVEHQLWQEVSSGMRQGPKRWLLDLFQGKLQDEELKVWVRSMPSWPSPRKTPSGSNWRFRSTKDTSRVIVGAVWARRGAPKHSASMNRPKGACTSGPWTGRPTCKA